MFKLCQIGLFHQICKKASKFKDYVVTTKDNEVVEFNEHMASYGLSYGTVEEYQFRLKQYLNNDKVIKQVNK